jgi:multidrug efflux pump subunit AcrA (membrane-fusion protein)
VTATVRIAVAHATDVLVVPMSATTPIDENHASVRVLTPSGVVEEVAVTTGVKGVARIEVVDGLRAGQQVVLADPTKPLPGLDIFGGEEPAPAEEPQSPEPTR